MACKMIGLTAAGSDRVRERYRFRGVRRTYGEIELVDGHLPSLLDARVDCQLGFPQRTGEECRKCPRLLSWEPGPSPWEVTLRCAWLHTDLIADRMTGSRSLVSVAPDDDCRQAERVAAREGVHRLLVIADQKLVGIVCRHDLRRASDARVETVMQREVIVIDATATLGEAAAAMRELEVGCLPVMRAGRLVGIITKGDLLRTGVAEELFT